MKRIICAISALLFAVIGVAQQGKIGSGNDTLPGKTLDSVILTAQLRASNASYLPAISGMNIFSGKRTNTLDLSFETPGTELNLGRTVLAKIPGLTMWEMDGAGTQLNIGSRGTDPHRSIEMNMRQNGYNTNSDIFGYPENHYSVPMQAIEQVQLVRGSAALQFGPQFGGMMNYKIKEGDSLRPIAVESVQTVGSNSFFNSYNALGGTKGKFNYYVYYDNRHGDGWRENAKFSYHAYYAHLKYKLNDKGEITAEFSRMDYVQQIAGGLTDQQFHENPQQSQRARNYFQPVINIPALKFAYKISGNTDLEISSHGLFGQRNSVQFINAGNIPDTINVTRGSYNPRQVDRDYYDGFTTEARILHRYKLGRINAALSGGIRYFSGLTKRRQKGVGTTGSDFDLSLDHPYGIDLHLKTDNYAAFAENVFYLNPKFLITPGVRFEIIKTDMSGVINNATVSVGYRSARSFPLFGVGFEYRTSGSSQVYGNISQAYRPYLYAFVTPADRVDKIDPSLKDSKGYNIDLGYRGHIGNLLHFDINAFFLYYGNKIGLISLTDPATGSYLYTTNIGNSTAKGVEAFGELSLVKLLFASVRTTDIKIFTSLAYNHAIYNRATITNGGINKSIRGNFVENAPEWIVKSGVNFNYRSIGTGIQYSYTSKAYNDAFNTLHSTNGITGMLPAYSVWDWHLNWQITRQYYVNASINNFTNEKYFNRRITFYPGPGILPADGRTFTISFGLKI